MSRATKVASAALIGCGVPIQLGSAIKAAGIQPGGTIVVVGADVIGIDAVQGAVVAGARHVVAVDAVELNCQRASESGANHVFSSMEEAVEAVKELTRGHMADACIVKADPTQGDYVGKALNVVGVGGRVVVAAQTEPETDSRTTRCLKLCDTAKGMRRTSTDPATC